MSNTGSLLGGGHPLRADFFYQQLNIVYFKFLYTTSRPAGWVCLGEKDARFYGDESRLMTPNARSSSKNTLQDLITHLTKMWEGLY